MTSRQIAHVTLKIALGCALIGACLFAGGAVVMATVAYAHGGDHSSGSSLRICAYMLFGPILLGLWVLVWGLGTSAVARCFELWRGRSA